MKERRIYCVVPPELAGRLHDHLRAHFGAGEVDVVVERRGGDRRSGAERRAGAGSSADGPRSERRRIVSATGRRIADRRSPVGVLGEAERPELPRRARRYADRLLFVERLEPSSEAVEDADTARLVARFQAGESQAFTDLYLRYFDRIYGYLRLLLRDSHEAEDFAQHVFVEAFERLPQFRLTGAPVRVWLFTIARNAALSRLRKTSRLDVVEPARLDASRELRSSLELEPSILGWISDRELLMFVERLPQVQRQVIALRHMLDLTNLEIAAMLGRSPNDVAAIHKRGLAFLRARLIAVGRGPQKIGRARMRAWSPQAPVLRHRRFALYR
jgi:RNA polymerase sigma-70 factor (ECF subfamily)